MNERASARGPPGGAPPGGSCESDGHPDDGSGERLNYTPGGHLNDTSGKHLNGT